MNYKDPNWDGMMLARNLLIDAAEQAVKDKNHDRVMVLCDAAEILRHHMRAEAV